ncbi:uncharacterized protein LOC135346882 isoform X2 [Halichondria panicea]|uniref:uncharacterized protein LOC135346882 isoform X2 n=1 Tax=Halichondria panicea TaxID=6063 RepID=UPI00312B75DB
MPRTLPLALVVLLVLCACGSECLQSTEYQHTIYIDLGNPNSVNDSSCYTNSVEHPCGDINIALAFPDKQHSTIFYLSSNANHHKLANNATNMLFTEGSQIAFVGDNGTATVECMEGAGLAFINSTNINVTRVSFLYCGAWRPSTSSNFTSKTLQLISIQVGLYFYNCRNVNMSHMSVSNSTNAVGVVMYSVAGENYIDNSHFDNNRINESNKNESGGGGFAVEFNYCKPGDNTCGGNNTQTENNSDAVYTFEGCSFSLNRGIDQSGDNGSDTTILPRNEIHSSFGRGGGLSLYFKGTAMKNTITINNCTFSNNSAGWGAGLNIVIADNTIQNVINVTGSHFTDNTCYVTESSKGSGGGVRVSSVVYYTHLMDKLLMRNSVSFEECIFVSNIALLGGAMALFYHHQQFSHRHQVFNASISGCSFESNSARLGSAVSVDTEHYYPKGELGTAVFSSCVFNNNTIVYLDPEVAQYSVGIGALYVSEIPVTFEGYMCFHFNNGTALAVVGTIVTISDQTNLEFKNNSGSNGGAISLLGIATLIIGKGTSFLFANNLARLNGGAIFNKYIGKEDLRSSVKCFLQYADPFENPKTWDTKFTFDSNQAGKLGQSIFSSTILPCAMFQRATNNITNVTDIFCWNTSTWVYKNSKCSKEIYTSPRYFRQNKPNQSIFPGHTFKLHIEAKDDLDHDVSSSTVYTAYTNSSLTSEVQHAYAYISDQYVGISGSENQNITLILNTDGFRDWHVEINLEMLKCPPGFASSSDNANTTCKCIGGGLGTFQGNLICNEDDLISEIRNGYWIGFVPVYNNTKLYMGSSALVHKYSKNETFRLSKRYDHLDKIQCSHLHRTGPLCGECLKNYSTAVNTFDYSCVQCNRNTTNFTLNVVAYLGLTYLPYLVIFVIIIYFDIRLMSGPLVGFILYAQLIGSGVIDLTLNTSPYFKGGDSPHKIQRMYRIAYGIFNLNTFSQFMEPFCIRENLNALDVICLDYAVAAFPLLLIIVIRLLMPLRSFKFFSKKRRIGNVSTAVAVNNMNKPIEKPLIHVFVGFIYLSYTKYSLTSTKLFSTTEIFDQDGVTPNITLIYYAGQYYFGQKDYVLPYGLLAITIFIFVAVLLPLLLLGPLDFMNWLLDQPKFYFLTRYWPTLRINIFLDAFRGCYKTNCKYFTGIYFLFRLIIFLIYVFSSNEVLLRLWQLIFVVLLLMLVVWKQPYQKKFLNCLDSLILFNVVLINSISIYLHVQHIAEVRSEYPRVFFALGVILIWLPMVYFVLYLCWLILHKRRVYYLAVYRLRPVINCFRKLCGEPALVEEQPLLNPAPYSDNTVSYDADTDLFNRAEENVRSRRLQRENRKSPNNTNSSSGGSAQSGGSSATPNTN